MRLLSNMAHVSTANLPMVESTLRTYCLSEAEPNEKSVLLCNHVCVCMCKLKLEGILNTCITQWYFLSLSVLFY